MRTCPVEGCGRYIHKDRLPICNRCMAILSEETRSRLFFSTPYEKGMYDEWMDDGDFRMALTIACREAAEKIA